MTVYIQRDDSTKIYTPVLTVNYTEFLTADIQPTVLNSNGGLEFYPVPYSFRSVYSMETRHLIVTLYGTFVFATVLFSLLSLHRYYKDNSRDTRLFTDISASQLMNTDYFWYVDQMATLAHSWNLIFFPFTVLMCWYCFVFFKLQKEVSIMLPPQYNYSNMTNADAMTAKPTSLYYW